MVCVKPSRQEESCTQRWGSENSPEDGGVVLGKPIWILLSSPNSGTQQTQVKGGIDGVQGGCGSCHSLSGDGGSHEMRAHALLLKTWMGCPRQSPDSSAGQASPSQIPIDLSSHEAPPQALSQAALPSWRLSDAMWLATHSHDASAKFPLS